MTEEDILQLMPVPFLSCAFISTQIFHYYILSRRYDLTVDSTFLTRLFVWPRTCACGDCLDLPDCIMKATTTEEDFIPGCIVLCAVLEETGGYILGHFLFIILG